MESFRDGGGTMVPPGRAYADTGEEPFEPTIGPAGSLLVNVPATIALVRGYLAQLHGDARASSW